MRLEPGDDQRALADTVRDVLADLVTPEARRERRDGAAVDRSVWRTLGELGVFSILVPESDGGLGLGLVEVCLMLEEVGRSGLSAPVLEASTVVAPLLARLDDDRRELLDEVLAGEVVSTVALSPRGGLAGDASDAMVIASLGDTVHLDRAEAFAVRPQRSLDDSRHACVVEVVDARAVPLQPEELARLGSEVLVANAALLVGISSALLDASVAYALERHQFGRPIGSFQALKHRLADAHVELEAGRAAVWSAAIELDECVGDAAAIAAHVAAAVAGRAAELVNDSALQVHGGIGYTWEHELQTWLKQGLVVGRRLGGPAHHERLAARAAGVLGSPTAIGGVP